MTLLSGVSETVRQVAQAIALALGMDVEIVDNDFTIIGGTDLYQGKIGTKEEGGRVDGDSFYATVLRRGVTEVVEDTLTYANYGLSCISENYSKEVAEICTPIKTLDGRTIGIIGLVAFNEKQREAIINNQAGLIAFVEKMSELLASKAVQEEIQDKLESDMNKIGTIMETAPEGIIALDRYGNIERCNRLAARLLKTRPEDLIHQHISIFMPGTPALDVLRTGKGYADNDEIYRSDKGQLHFMVSASPYQGSLHIEGAVMFFKNIEVVQKLAYSMSKTTPKFTVDSIIGESEVIARAKNLAMLIAGGSSTVLITGESGTGKEVFAKAIHYSSLRAKGPFVTVNCGAIPETLLESELFGYEKGAFTGASEKGKMGKFEFADGGTIFLDEIGDMPLPLQVKMLHVVQNMCFERVGGNKTIHVDVRIIAATNKDLEEMIISGTFREDLFYRLSVIPLAIPPLCDRKADIILLMKHFLKKYNQFMNKHIEGFTREVEQIYLDYPWPGNVRELENAVEYGVNMTFTNQIERGAVPLRLYRNNFDAFKLEDNLLSLKEQLQTYEKEIIFRKLRKSDVSNMTMEKVAGELGLSRATLYRKMQELGIEQG